MKYSHLSLDERQIIENGLRDGKTFQSIALSLGKDSSTISKEIKRGRIFKPRSRPYSPNNCIYRRECDQASTCGKNSQCRKSSCLKCGVCNNFCEKFKAIVCKHLLRGKLVCNGCVKRSGCQKDKYYYYASKAHDQYRLTLSETRQGISVEEHQLIDLDELVKPLIKKGQSIAHIYSTHASDIPISSRTLYEYIDKGILSVINLDLPRKVKYKKRRKSPKIRRELIWIKGRTHADFQDFIDLNPDANVVEMDTVEGKKGGKALLTFHFRRSKCLIAFLIREKTQQAVLEVFNSLEKALGPRKFKKCFSLILTDNGSEFLNPLLLETGLKGQKRTSVYYCNPNASYEKGALEKNHEFIRYMV
jgi:IS30 family transposase